MQKIDTRCYGKCLCKNMKFILDSIILVLYTRSKGNGFFAK